MLLQRTRIFSFVPPRVFVRPSIVRGEAFMNLKERPGTGALYARATALSGRI
jgi:hypothetical protein